MTVPIRLPPCTEKHRYFSGFFFSHPLLDGFDFYWRVEPRVQFFCDMHGAADPFRQMQQKNLSYAFNIIVTEASTRDVFFETQYHNYTAFALPCLTGT